MLVDQILFMKRCGFDSFAPEAEIDAATLEAALTRYDHVYQKAADGAGAGMETAAWRVARGCPT